MRFWFDTEFIEDGVTIDLISIGIVAEDGREYYAVSSEFDEQKASPWVWENVLSQIPPLDVEARKSRAQIRHELLRFIGTVEPDAFHGFWGVSGDKSPEIWAYCGAYDWVVLCQLFGTMMDLPDGWPRFARDVKQLAEELGNPQLPAQARGHHHALHDARWTRQAWEYLKGLPRIK